MKHDATKMKLREVVLTLRVTYATVYLARESERRFVGVPEGSDRSDRIMVRAWINLSHVEGASVRELSFSMNIDREAGATDWPPSPGEIERLVQIHGERLASKALVRSVQGTSISCGG